MTSNPFLNYLINSILEYQLFIIKVTFSIDTVSRAKSPIYPYAFSIRLNPYVMSAVFALMLTAFDIIFLHSSNDSILDML